MKRSRLLFASGALFVLAAAGCQAIAGIQTRTTDPLLTGCTLPSAGNGRVRLVDVAAVPGSSDFCIRASGASWGRPIFRDGGNDALCLGTASQPGGLTYGQATIPFAVPAGKIDVKAIPSGQTCSAVATSEADGIVVGDSTKGASVTTLMRYGGGSASREAISASPEAAPGSISTGNSAVRVVNALSGSRSIEWGFSSSSTLPTTVGQIVDALPTAPGAATSSNATSSLAGFTASGYAQVLPEAFNLAVFYSDDASSSAIALYTLPSSEDLATFYVIGDPNDASNLHPVTGLYCEDKPGLSNTRPLDAGAGDAGGALTAQDTALLAQCTLAPLSLFSVDLVNTSLYGIAASVEAQRRPYIITDVAARTSDLVCLLEVDALSDRTAIANAAAATNAKGGPGRFPYSYMITTDGTTPPTNPADVQTPPANPPCGASSVPASVVNKVYSCVEGYCSTTTGGDPSGQGVVNQSSDCLSTFCTLAFAPLYRYPLTEGPGSAQYSYDACFACSVLYFVSETQIGTALQNCTTQSAAPYAFAGQTPMMMLSHYPLKNQTSYNFPSTGYRRGILKAQVEIENGKTIDFFCGELSSPLIDSSIPYTGSYGSDLEADGGPGGNGWETEQDLQAKEGLAWIQQQITADGVPAIVAMDLHSDDVGTASNVDGGLASVSPEVVDLFNASTLDPATVKGAPAQCDYCPPPQNPYNGATPPYEFLHAYLSGFPENATQSETLWGDDNSEVTIPSTLPSYVYVPPGGTGPLLEYYAHNFTILRP